MLFQKIKILLVCFLFLLFVSVSESREWTAKSGHKIDGEFVKLDGQTVYLALPNSKTAEVSLDQLINKDQDFVKEQMEKNKNPFVITDKLSADQPEKTVTSVKIDRNTPLDVLKAEAEKDNPDALCWLSIYYAGGLNVCPIDKTKIPNLNQKAATFAENGSAAAQFCQGICYFCGYGVKLNHEEAVKWFRQSAEQNFAPAQERLAMCLLLGDGVKEDKVEAIKLLQKSVDQDFALAMYDFGFCYAMGNGVPENQNDAVKWYRKAADKGLTTAQLTMGHCYYKGIGVKEDKTEALAWYKKAALQGNKEADEIVKQIEKTAKDNAKPTTEKIDTENEKQKETIEVEEKPETAALKTAVAFGGLDLPRYTAPGVLLTSVDNIDNDTVQYQYVLENVTKDSPKLENVSEANLKAALLEDLKKSDDTKFLGENKVNLVYLYKDKEGNLLFKINLKHEEYYNKTQPANTHVETKKAFTTYVKGHFEGISQDGKWLFHSGDNKIWGMRLSDRKSFYYEVKDNNFLAFEGVKISTDEKYVQIGYSVAAGKKNEPLADLKHVTVHAAGNNAGKIANVRAKYWDNITVGKQKEGYTGKVYYQDAGCVITIDVDEDGTVFTVRIYPPKTR